MSIDQISIIGTGLIGGSFALAVRKRGFRGRIVGCDRGPVLQQALDMGAIDRGSEDAGQAIAGSQVALLATPVGAIIDFLDRVGPALSGATLVTDVGSTKREIVARAQAVFREGAVHRFLAGHPMAGKEHSGIEHATSELFQGAVWLVTPLPNQDVGAGLCGEFLALVEKIGAGVVNMGVERHDRVCAWISHLPQMLSTALAATVVDELGNDPELLAIGGRALREMTRIAASPYSMWRDIALTNSDHIQEALQRVEQRLAHIRENLKTAELRKEFETGNRFHGDTGARSD